MRLPPGLPRRIFTGAALGWPFLLLGPNARAAAGSPTVDQAALLGDAVRRSGAVLMLRHAQTVPGVGDPPGFRLNDCSTQRNLSEAGRAQARRIGEWLRTHGLTPSVIATSQWCRCRDTATAIHSALVNPSGVNDWPALNSFFDDRSTEPQQSAELRTALASLRPGQLKLWVTHQVNVTALTGEVPAMGEAFALGSTGTPLKILARLRFVA